MSKMSVTDNFIKASADMSVSRHFRLRWKHKTRDIKFVLVVDDFSIKYIKEADLDHLIAALEKHYEVTVDKEGQEYVRIELDWDYENRKVHLSMQPYLQKALRQFNNVVPSKRQDSPYPHVPPKYGEIRNNSPSMAHPKRPAPMTSNTSKRSLENFCGGMLEELMEHSSHP
jgi:hypothetical protein